MTAKEKLDSWIGTSVLLDEETEELWKLIEAYVDEEHEARCDDCEERKNCDDCDERRGEPRHNEGYE